MIGLRYERQELPTGRSYCPHCAHTLEALDLIPVFSYLFLRGKCRYCKAPISLQYPLIELWTAILFVTLYHLFGLSVNFVLNAVVFCFYTAILIVDLRQKLIPNRFVFPAIFFSVVYRFLIHGSLIDWLMGPILFSLFFLGWVISRGRAVGFADGTLSLSIGLLLGGAKGLSAIVLGFWIGTIILVPVVIFGKKGLTMKSEIPFGPFLILGAWISLIFSLDLLHLSFFT